MRLPIGSRVATIVLVAVLHARSATSQRGVPPEHHGEAMPAASLLDTATARLVALAREASARFRSRDSAIVHGYRRVGMDFPAMGEHWVNASLILSGRFNAADPAMLSYITINGTPTLAGVAYAVLLDSGRSPPLIPGAADMWHAHNGTLAAESVTREHHGGAITDEGTRLAVLHVWTEFDNPDGLFNAENWGLPFARLGLAVPSPLPRSTSRILALLAGGREYFTLLGGATPTSSEDVAVLLDEAATIAAAVVGHARHTGSLTLDDVRRLDAVWQRTLDSITHRVSAAVARRMNGDQTLR